MLLLKRNWPEVEGGGGKGTGVTVIARRRCPHLQPAAGFVLIMYHCMKSIVITQLPICYILCQKTLLAILPITQLQSVCYQMNC